MKFAQVVDSKIHFLFDPVQVYGVDTIEDVRALFTHDMLFVDVSHHQEVVEGMEYDPVLDSLGEMQLSQPPTDQEKIFTMLTQQEQADLDRDEIMLQMDLSLEEIKLEQQLRGV